MIAFDHFNPCNYCKYPLFLSNEFFLLTSLFWLRVYKGRVWIWLIFHHLKVLPFDLIQTFSMKFFKTFCQIIPFREFWYLVHFQRKHVSKSLIETFFKYFPMQNTLFCFCLALVSFHLVKKKFDFALKNVTSLAHAFMI